VTTLSHLNVDTWGRGPPPGYVSPMIRGGGRSPPSAWRFRFWFRGPVGVLRLVSGTWKNILRFGIWILRGSFGVWVAKGSVRPSTGFRYRGARCGRLGPERGGKGRFCGGTWPCGPPPLRRGRSAETRGPDKGPFTRARSRGEWLCSVLAFGMVLVLGAYIRAGVHAHGRGLSIYSYCSW
jgi:hypothetical protein